MAARWRRCTASRACICRPRAPVRGASMRRWKRFEGATMDQFNRMLARYEPMVLGIFRIMVGLLLFQYGVTKLFKYPPVPAFAKVEPMSLIGAAGALELVLGGLLIIGLFTRPVAFILCGEM